MMRFDVLATVVIDGVNEALWSPNTLTNWSKVRMSCPTFRVRIYNGKLHVRLSDTVTESAVFKELS